MKKVFADPKIKRRNDLTLPGWTLILLHFSLAYIGSGKILKLLLSAHTNVHIQDRLEQDESGEVVVHPGTIASYIVVNIYEHPVLFCMCR